MIKRVQVFTPIYRLEPETVKAVLALEWDEPITWIFQRDNPTLDGRLNILHQYQRARGRFLASSEDALLIIESDIIPPADALQKLAGLDADVAYGAYRFRTSSVVNIFEKYPGNPRNEGESLSIHPLKLAHARRAGKIPCTGGGLGCILIKRHVLQKIQFRLEGKQGAHCDTWFNRDVLHNGFTQMADMSVVCGHKNEKGEVLWPF